jgi:hypothetical protein
MPATATPLRNASKQAPWRAQAADEDEDATEHPNHGGQGEGRAGEAGDYENDHDAPERG